MIPFRPIAAAALAVFSGTAVVHAQSLDDRLDEARYLRGLTDLQLPEVLAHYIETHPAIDPLQAAMYGIAMERMAMSRPDVRPAERLEHLERILATRAKLIDDHRDDLDRAIWLADQASDLLFELLPSEGAGLARLFGTPSAAQRDRAARAAAGINAAAAEAEIEVDRAILAVEAMPDRGDRLARQQRRRRLAEEERDRRIPFVRGIGACLHGEINVEDPNERRVLFEIAVDTLLPVIERLEGFLAARARLYAGLALMRLGDADEAAEMLRRLTVDPAATRVDVFAARALLVQRTFDTQGITAALAELERLSGDFKSREDLFYMVLAADLEFALRRAAARGLVPEQRSARLAEAFGVYIDLLEVDSDALPETIESIVYARLRNAADDDTPLERLPPLVTVARADHLAASDTTRSESIALYERVVDRADLGDRERAAALFGLGWALHRSGRGPEAIERFTDLADRYPRYHRAEQAIEAAVTLAAQRYRNAPGDSRARDRLRRVLDLLLQRYVNLSNVDRWRYLAGRVALDERRFDDAFTCFRQVTRDGPEWLDAQFMLANTRRTAFAGTSDVVERGRLAALLVEEVEPIREHLQDALDRGVPTPRVPDVLYYLAYLRVFVAEASLQLGRPQQAIDALADIESNKDLDGVVVAAALETRIDAYQALGRPQDAQRAVRRFAATAPARVPQVVPPMMAALQHDVEKLIDQSRTDEARRKAETELVPLAELLQAWLRRTEEPPENLAVIRQRVADGFRHAGLFAEALREYDELLREQPDALPFLLGRAECLFGQGERTLGEAMRLYKRIGAIGADRGREAYWLAQLRMLQILDQVGRNTQKIVPRIERLRQEDPTLGGDRFERDFNKLQSKHT